MTDDYDNSTRKEREDRFKIKNCVIPDSPKNTAKIQTKHANPATSISKFFIQDLTKKKKKPRELSDEDKSDVKTYFGVSDGASLVDERTSYYDTRGGWGW